jgi:hypothetical protein
MAKLDAYISWFREEVHGFQAALATQARGFHAAKRSSQVALHPAVDPDDSTLKPGCHAMAA